MGVIGDSSHIQQCWEGKEMSDSVYERGAVQAFKGLLILVEGLTWIEILCWEMCRCVDLTRCKSVCFPKCVGGIWKRSNKEGKFVNQGFYVGGYSKNHVQTYYLPTNNFIFHSKKCFNNRYNYKQLNINVLVCGIILLTWNISSKSIVS